MSGEEAMASHDDSRLEQSSGSGEESTARRVLRERPGRIGGKLHDTEGQPGSGNEPSRREQKQSSSKLSSNEKKKKENKREEQSSDSEDNIAEKKQRNETLQFGIGRPLGRGEKELHSRNQSSKSVRKCLSSDNGGKDIGVKQQDGTSSSTKEKKELIVENIAIKV